MTIEIKKNKINQGIFTFRNSDLKIKAEAKVTGMIHNALVSLTVVAIAKAWLPYTDEAPTTELVS